MAEHLLRPLLSFAGFHRKESSDDPPLGATTLEDVFVRLNTSDQGLTSEEADLRLRRVGPNKLHEKIPENKFLKFLHFMCNPLSWVMEAAAVMAIVLANGGGEGPDWRNFVGIVCLLVVNSTISFIEENSAGKAAAALETAPKTKVLRDGCWQDQDAAVLVPGDIISIKAGDVFPADVRLLGKGGPLEVDQSALNGNPLLVKTNAGDKVLTNSFCMHGETEAVVIGTRVRSTLLEEEHLNSPDQAIRRSRTQYQSTYKHVINAVGNFCICAVAVGMMIETVVMYGIQQRSYRKGINNLLVLLIGGIPIAMPTVLSLTLANGSQQLSQQGISTKRMTAIEEMAGMDVLLCSDITGTLTLNSLTVDRKHIEVIDHNLDRYFVILLAARASRLENQDAIDKSIVNMLDESREARANITEVDFLPFNPVDKRSTITYTDSEGNWYRVSKGAPEQILNLCQEKAKIDGEVHAIVDKFAEQGFQSIGVAIQEVPEKSKDSAGGPWRFCGLLPLFDPPRPDSADTISRALNLGVCVKVITGDQLVGRGLGVGDVMYPCSSLPIHEIDENITHSEDELIEKADIFAGASPEHKYEIVKILQERRHVVGLIGGGADDVPALKRADIGIAVAGATDAARNAADIVLTKPGLSLMISAVLTSRDIFQRMNTYRIYAVSVTIKFVLGFMILALIWEYDFPPFMVLVIAILNDGVILTISTDLVKPSAKPDSWKISEILATGVVIGTYLAFVTVFFYWVAVETTFFETHFKVKSLSGRHGEISSAIYLQVSIISQALVFVTRSRNWSFLERPGTLLICAFTVAQLVATLMAVYAKIGFASISGIGWGWAGVVWLYCFIFYIPLDIMKFAVRYALSGDTIWNLGFDVKAAFTSRKDRGEEETAFVSNC